MNIREKYPVQVRVRGLYCTCDEKLVDGKPAYSKFLTFCIRDY